MQHAACLVDHGVSVNAMADACVVIEVCDLPACICTDQIVHVGALTELV